MKQKHTIDVTIEADATVSIEVNGAKGRECLAITEELEKHLGKVDKRRHTKEYRERPVEAKVRQ